MTIRFRYRLITTPQPVIPLGGRYSRPRPIISVTLLGPTGSWAVDARLDSAADDTVFQERIAAHIGINLANAPQGMARGAASNPIPVRYAEVALRIADNQEQREWNGWVGFTAARLNRPLLGFAGFLQFFWANFKGDLEEVELTVNRLYQGK